MQLEAPEAKMQGHRGDSFEVCSKLTKAGDVFTAFFAEEVPESHSHGPRIGPDVDDPVKMMAKAGGKREAVLLAEGGPPVDENLVRGACKLVAAS